MPTDSVSPGPDATRAAAAGPMTRYRWVICALLFFSTTFNYLDRQVISYLKEYFCAPVEYSESFSTFTVSDINNLPVLANRLSHPTDGVTTYVKVNLSAPTAAALASYPNGDPNVLQTNLINDLNALISHGPIYDAARFSGVTLRPETQALLASNPSGDKVPHLNRVLLDDALPRGISRGGFGWSNTDFGNLTSFFTAFYAGMTIFAGWMIDKIGTKIGLALSLILWSIFGIANAFVGRLVSMHILVRSAFAIGEGGNFPASIKTVAEWFPKKERALATGIFNSGSNFGAMIAALFVPWCMIQFGDRAGWKMAFILTGAVGLIWLIFWFWLYEIPARQKRLSKAEFDYIHSDKDDAQTEQKPSKGSFGKLFSFAGRIPRSGFWGTTILLSILTFFIFLMTTLLVVPKIFVAGQTAQQVLRNVFVVPNSVSEILIFRIVWLALMAWIFLALQAKRWRDMGKNPALIAINLVPVLGTVVSILIVGIVKGGDPKQGEASPGVLGYPQTWSFFWGKFLTDGVWWFYLFWLPDYLHKQFNMDKHQIMMPTFIVYGIAIIGSIYGGSIPMTLIKKGMPVYKARMTAMFLIAMCPLFVLLTQHFGDVARFGTTWAPVLAIAMICIGAAAHQAWSANLFTTVSDMFPKRSVGSVTGIGSLAGGLGGVIVQQFAGGLTDAFKATPQTAYMIMFFICALSYLIAWMIMKALVPQHKPITDL